MHAGQPSVCGTAWPEEPATAIWSGPLPRTATHEIRGESGGRSLSETANKGGVEGHLWQTVMRQHGPHAAPALKTTTGQKNAAHYRQKNAHLPNGRGIPPDKCWEEAAC